MLLLLLLVLLVFGVFCKPRNTTYSRSSSYTTTNAINSNIATITLFFYRLLMFLTQIPLFWFCWLLTMFEFFSFGLITFSSAFKEIHFATNKRAFEIRYENMYNKNSGHFKGLELTTQSIHEMLLMLLILMFGFVSVLIILVKRILNIGIIFSVLQRNRFPTLH